MAIYDYRKGKERVEAILDNELKVIEQEKLPMTTHLHSQTDITVG